jgi:hypothetical protein
MNYFTARDVVRRIGVTLVLDDENDVIGLAVGRKGQRPITWGGRDDFCITAFVLRRPYGLPAPRGRLPVAVITSRASPTSFGPDDIQIVELSDVFRPQASSSHSNPAGVNTQKWFESLRPGLSIANPTGTYPTSLLGGTAGFFVEKGSQRFLVSCNHVLARVHTDKNNGPASEVIIQPATMDLDGHARAEYKTESSVKSKFGIAELYAAVPLDLLPARAAAGGPPTNTVDAAMAELFSSEKSERAHDSLGRLPFAGLLSGQAKPFDVDENTDQVIGRAEVFKVGRTTGYTEGVVTDIHAVTTLDYGFGRRAAFIEQLAVRPGPDNTGYFTQEGDSGSALVTDEHKVAGMLIGGSPERSLASPIQAVLAELEQASGISPLTIVT